MSNDLPVYPTPQQAVLGMNQHQQNPPRRTQRPPQHPPQQLSHYYKQTQLSQLPPQPTPASYMGQSPTYSSYLQSQTLQPQYYQDQQRQTLSHSNYAPSYNYQQQSQQQPQQQLQPQHQPQQYRLLSQQSQPVHQSHSQPQSQPQPQTQQAYAPGYYQQPQQTPVQPVQQQPVQQQPVQQQQQYQQQQYQQPQYASLLSVPQYLSPPTQHVQPHVPTKKPPHNRSRENVSEPPKISSKQRLENELRATFERVDTNRSGRILARELSLALTNFDNTRFQDLTVRLMIKLFTNELALGLNFDQFVSLWKYLTAYKKLFVAADANKLGDISFGEFQRIIEQIGYKLNVDLVLHLFLKFSNKESPVNESVSVGKLKFDAFIELLVYLRKLTDVFKQYDKDLSGVATINYLDFLFEISNLT